MKQCNCNKQIGKTGVIVHDEWCNIYHHPMNNPETVEDWKERFDSADIWEEREDDPSVGGSGTTTVIDFDKVKQFIDKEFALRDKQLREDIGDLVPVQDNKKHNMAVLRLKNISLKGGE